MQAQTKANCVSPPQSNGRRDFKWKWVIGSAAIIALFVGFRMSNVEAALQALLKSIEQIGAWGPVLFVAAYVVATVLFVPGYILTVGAGALFGIVKGSLLVSVAATAGAATAFLTGRYLARDAIARRMERQPRFAAIDRAIGKEGWKIVLLARLSPLFPFTLLNYAFGLTHIRFVPYVVASWLGMIPGTVMYVYLGALARAGAEPRQRTAAEWALYGLGLVATVVVTIITTRIAWRALAERTRES